MTPSQKQHAQKAERLQREAAQTIENTKSGHSGAAAKTILEVNIERKKAGLITGKINR